jgi:molecular chaperone GrpE
LKKKADAPDKPAAPAPSVPGSDDSQPDTAPSLDDLQQEIARLKTDVLRAYADAENLKRRALIDAERKEKYAVASFAKEMLPVVDSLERALALAIDESPFKDGIKLTLATMLTALAKFNVLPIASLGQVFDPNLHQVMQETPGDDPAAPPGTIVAEWQKGYRIEDRVLREANVVVTK